MLQEPPLLKSVPKFDAIPRPIRVFGSTTSFQIPSNPLPTEPAGGGGILPCNVLPELNAQILQDVSVLQMDLASYLMCHVCVGPCTNRLFDYITIYIRSLLLDSTRQILGGLPTRQSHSSNKLKAHLIVNTWPNICKKVSQFSSLQTALLTIRTENQSPVFFNVIFRVPFLL